MVLLIFQVVFIAILVASVFWVIASMIGMALEVRRNRTRRAESKCECGLYTLDANTEKYVGVYVQHTRGLCQPLREVIM